MRHRWKKIKPEKVNGSGSLRIKEQYVSNCMECIHCGLKKGNTRRGWFSTLIYFKNNTILSIDRIPYKCNKDFIGENEFKV
jgi:hypothetical protein